MCLTTRGESVMKKILTVMMTLCMALLIAGCGDDTPKFEGMYKYQYSSTRFPYVLKIEKSNNIYSVYDYTPLKDDDYEERTLLTAALDEENLMLREPGSNRFVFFDKGDKKMYINLAEKLELTPLTNEEIKAFQQGKKLNK